MDTPVSEQIQARTIIRAAPVKKSKISLSQTPHVIERSALPKQCRSHQKGHDGAKEQEHANARRDAPRTAASTLDG